MIEIVILWVYYTIPFGYSLFWHFWGITFQFRKYFVWLRITDEGLVAEMSIWSIFLIKSDLEWGISLRRNLLCIFQLPRECQCWLTTEFSRVHVFKFCGRLRLILNVLEHQNLSNYHCVGFYTIPFYFNLFWHFLALPEMRIWSLLWINSDLNLVIS